MGGGRNVVIVHDLWDGRKTFGCPKGKQELMNLLSFYRALMKKSSSSPLLIYDTRPVARQSTNQSFVYPGKICGI